MRKSEIRRRKKQSRHVRLIAATSLACATPVFAQNATEPAPAGDVAGALEEIVVTASGKDKTQLNSSVSVTSVNANLIKDFKPSSEAEVFRLIPGIQVAGTAGPGGNSNIAVRGLPVATGGSPFVQIQEDGLPTVLFGDIQFGNNDYWTHFDSSVERVEAVRGGSASTFASQAPGAVINYISHTGKDPGGFIGLSRGLGYDETRVDFRYGDRISDTSYFHVGGYFKDGRGPLHADYKVSNSVQVKGNITKELDDGKGFIRFLFKYADTTEPNYTGAPALANISGKSVSGIKQYPGFDGRSESNYSIYNQDFLIVNRDGVLERVKMDGITTQAKSIGSQFHYDFTDNINIDDNIRWTKMSGGFASPFLNVTTRSGIIGSTVNGAVVDSIRYAQGPNAGQAYTGTYVDNNVNVRTNIRDVGSFANDFNLSGKFDVGAGRLTTRVGWFFMDQKIAMDWHVNKSTREVSGNNPSQLDLYDAAGNKLTANGISGFNNNWGACCSRDYDLSYTDNAPYVALDLDTDKFGIDASVRRENVRASGTTIQSTGTEFNTVVDGVNIPTMLANGPQERLNYSRSYNSWSVGALFKATSNTSIFVRGSRGGRFNSDRQTVSGKIRADGQLCTQADVGTGPCTTDGVSPSVDIVNQYELGIKNRGSLFGGSYTAELTLLKGDFKQSTFELSATKCPGGAGGCIIDAKYKSTGAEFYGTYAHGPFSFVANATFSRARKQGAGATNFVRSDGLPNLTYTVSSNYAFPRWVTVGLTATGQTNALDSNGFEYPGSVIFGANLTVTPIDRLDVGLQVYNLFDTFDLRGNGGISDSSVSPTVIGGAPALGRTVTASVRFHFK